MIFADDIFWLSAFGTNSNPTNSKPIFIIFTKKADVGILPKTIILNGNLLPWGTQVEDLGHMLQSDNSMKRCFHRQDQLTNAGVSPNIFIRIMDTYAASLCGSNTWDTFSPECEWLFNSYNVTICSVLNLYRCTHRYLKGPSEDHASTTTH